MRPPLALPAPSVPTHGTRSGTACAVCIAHIYAMYSRLLFPPDLPSGYLTPFPRRGFRYFASASRATADRSRELRRPPARPASTHTSLPHPRRKLLAMWPVCAARLPHLDMLPEVVWAGAQRQRPYDKDVLKNKDFLNRRLYSTIHSDHQHGPNAMSRCAYVLVGFG